MNDGLASIESTVPLPSKSHAYLIESPSSSSLEPSLENLTVSGALPLVGVAESTAVGAVEPLVYCHLYMPASALAAKKPSPYVSRYRLPSAPYCMSSGLSHSNGCVLATSAWPHGSVLLILKIFLS